MFLGFKNATISNNHKLPLLKILNLHHQFTPQMESPKPASVYEFNFLNLLQKSVFKQICNYRVSQIIQYILINSAINSKILIQKYDQDIYD